jgi:glucoamylase
VGDTSTALRSLIYLAVTQRESGCFSQNYWIDGRPYWTGIQLDEVAFPIILAWRLRKANGLANYNPLPMVKGALSFILTEGPLSLQDRWEEASGYSPSTLAAVIAALVCGAEFLYQADDDETAAFVLDYADFLNANLVRWTVTTTGTLHPEISRHFIRVNPAPLDADGYSDECADCGTIRIANQRPGAQYEFPAKDIIDAGFLELVRYGVCKPDTPLFQDSLKVVDRLLKVDLPQGPCWRRYNHDGYGQREDGTGFEGWGAGRAWPLLTGERAHYELAAGRDAVPLLKTFEKFAKGLGLFPEQVWDAADSPDPRYYFGAPTSAAIPLAWAHAEYIKLVRSIGLGHAVDRIAPVYERYAARTAPEPKIDVWSKNRHPRTVRIGTALRFIYSEDFLVRWTTDDWQNTNDTQAARNALNLHYADIPVPQQNGAVRFTLCWMGRQEWDAREYTVSVESEH